MTGAEHREAEPAYWRTLPGSVMTLAGVLVAMLVVTALGALAVYHDFTQKQHQRSLENGCIVEILMQPTLDRSIKAADSCAGLYPELEEKYG